MAQTGYTPISIYYSSTASATPTAGNLVAGELAINTADGKLFYKDSAGVVQTIASKGTGTIGGSNTQVQYNNAGAFAGSANFVFDGTSSLSLGTGISGAASPSLRLGNSGSGGGVVTGTLSLGSYSTGYGSNIVSSSDFSSSSASYLAFGTTSTGASGLSAPVERMRIDSTGNVGIGTNSPSSYGLLAASKTQTTPTIVAVENGSASTSAGTELAFFYQSGKTGYIRSQFDGGDFNNTYQTNKAHIWKSGTTEYMRLDNAGNVSIGTSTAFSKFGVSTTNGNLGITGGTTSGGNRIQSFGATTTSNGYLAFEGYSAEYMRIDTSGNVGIGTSTIGGNSTNRTVTAEGSSSANFIVNRTGNESGALYAFSGAIYAGSNTNHPFIFNTNATERMRVDTSGNLLVGTTSNAGLGISIQPSSTIILNNNALASGAVFLSFRRSSSEIGFIDQVGTTSVRYSTTSDYRLKQNVAPMTGALATVAKLKPVTYTWKADGSNGQGFIAHELQEVVPDCVTGKKDAMRTEQYEISPAIPAEVDEDGKVIKEAVEAVMGEREVPAYQGIDTSFLVATLTAAIQEQQAMIEELKAKVAALEAA